MPGSTALWSRVTVSLPAINLGSSLRTIGLETPGMLSMWQEPGGSSSVIGEHDTLWMQKRFQNQGKLNLIASGNKCQTIFKDQHFNWRYEYDDHYFLTDPKEFIYEFFPLQPEWQLLKEPISLEEFEELPFVRSLFFRYQLAFPTEHMKSVMSTDQTGEEF